jgi:hypothetical protein
MIVAAARPDDGGKIHQHTGKEQNPTSLREVSLTLTATVNQRFFVNGVKLPGSFSTIFIQRHAAHIVHP